MTAASLPLAAAALFWIAIHLGLAGSPLRMAVVRAIGANPYRGAFSLLSAIGIVALAIAYRDADHAPIWDLGEAGRWLVLLLMLPALLLLVGSVTGPNPTAVGGERLLARGEHAHGIQRITRHPMLTAFALWSLGHLLVRGTVAGILLFGAILVTVVAGMASIDRKRARSEPRHWADFARETSAVPFAAILAGRNRLAWREIGAWRLMLALILWLALVAIHPFVFGVPALPGS
ncbi:MAG: NnrU family protein [Alphaproteobacteria bacterium]